MSMGDVVFSCLVLLPLTGLAPALRGACTCGCRSRSYVDEAMERAKGFEPSTPTLARLCSTPELRPRISCGVFVVSLCRIGTWLPGIQLPGPRSVPLRPYGSQLRSLLRSPRFQSLNVRDCGSGYPGVAPLTRTAWANATLITVVEGNIFNRPARTIVPVPRLADLAATYSPTS